MCQSQHPVAQHCCSTTSATHDTRAHLLSVAIEVLRQPITRTTTKPTCYRQLITTDQQHSVAQHHCMSAPAATPRNRTLQISSTPPTGSSTNCNCQCCSAPRQSVHLSQHARNSQVHSMHLHTHDRSQANTFLRFSTKAECTCYQLVVALQPAESPAAPAQQ
jgi:hypothetical protein